jgi:hypothetical protein
VISALCLLLGVISVGQVWSLLILEKRPVPFWRLVGWQATGWAYWAALTPVVVWGCRRFPLLYKEKMVMGLAYHLGTGLALGFVQGFIVGSVRMYFPIAEPRAFSFRDAVFASLSVVQFNLVTFWAIVGAFSAYELHRRWRMRELQAVQLREELARAQLQALQMQLQPHFLFNTLHTIATLVGDEPANARRMISRLGDFLRLTIAREATPLVPLASELEFVRAYLAIEEVRFQDRLTVKYRVAPDCLDLEVPSLILQPLVENAVKHGLSRKSGPARLEIRAERTGEQLNLEVRDDAGRFNGGAEGVGLKNTKGRLVRYYDGRSNLNVAVDDAGWTVAAIEIPLKNGKVQSPPLERG